MDSIFEAYPPTLIVTGLESLVGPNYVSIIY